MKKVTISERILNVLSLEDSIPDFEILREQIKSSEYHLNMTRVDTESDFTSALQNNKYDIILSDFKLPGFDAFGALRIANEFCPETPVICISGNIGEETAIELIKNGAVDYILKDRPGRLIMAIKRALDEANEKKIRKQAERALHENETRLNNLIMNLPGYMYRCKNDPNWTMMYISGGCEAITGYKPEEFTELKIVFNDLVHADYKDFLWTQFQMDQSQQKVFEQEYPIITKHGEPRWIWERGRMVFDDENNPLYIEGFITDITERKQLEDELAEHHATLTAILESANVPVFSLDTNYCYTTFNTVHCTFMKELYGAEIEIGHSLLDYINVHEDRETAKRNIDRALQGEHFVESDYSGDLGLKRVFFEISHNPILDSNNKIIGVSVFAHDISYRKQMELLLLRNMKFIEKLMKSIPIPVFYKDSNALYLGCNDAFTEHSGFKEEFIKGKSMMDLWPGEQSAIFHQKDLETLAGQNHLTYEATILDKDNKTREAIYFKNVYYDENGKAAGLIGAFIDITDRKQIENELRESENTLINAQKIANLGVYKSDILNNTWVCSDILNEIFGISDKKIKPQETWISLIHPDWKQKIMDYYLIDVLQNNVKFDIEYKIIRANDKSERWVHGIGELIYNSENQPISLIGTIQDITQRKEAEAQIIRNLKFTEALLKSIPIPVYFKDVNALYIGCNNAFSEHSGFAEEYIKGKSRMDLWPGEQSLLFHQRDLDTIAGNNHITFEAKVLDKENRTRDVIYFKNVFYDEIGKAAGIVGVFIDITDIKRTEEERKYLLASIENVVDRIVVKDLDLKIVAANKAWLKERGKNDISEVLGLTDAEAFGMDADAESVLLWMEDETKVKWLSEGEFIMKEQPIQLASGEKTIALVKRFPIFDVEGKVFCTGTIATDITEHKMEEEKLQLSEEKYRTVANYTNDWEFWVDQNGDFLYCSPSCERITGYNASAFLQNSDLQLEIVYPDDKELFESHKKTEDLAQEGHKEIQFRIICMDETVKWIGHVSRPVYSEFGSFIGIRGSNRDITERKATEQELVNANQKYKLLSENILDGVFICRNGLLEYVNIGMNLIFGYDDLELKNTMLTQLINPEYQSDIDIILNYKGTLNQTLNMELQCINRNKSIIYVDMILNYVASENAVYGVAHDVTENKLMHKKNIVKAIIQTEEKEKSYFSKELHDGLGPLLSTIKLYLQWSKRQNVDELREEILQKAESILEEALITVTEISNKLSPHLLEDYGLTSAVQSFMNKLQISTEMKVNFKSNMERRVESEIEAALYRAIIECVNNTIKHAQANNIDITLNDMGNQILLNYKDDGVGYNYEKVITEHKGLGLFNLKNRIQTIGGNLKMMSTPGQGVNYQIQVNI